MGKLFTKKEREAIEEVLYFDECAFNIFNTRNAKTISYEGMGDFTVFDQLGNRKQYDSLSAALVQFLKEPK
jgi:hypothetical protein